MSFARLLNELEGLRRLVLVPIISTHTSDKVVMMEAISPAQQPVINSWATSLYKPSAHGIEVKMPTAEVILWNMPPTTTNVILDSRDCNLRVEVNILDCIQELTPLYQGHLKSLAACNKPRATTPLVDHSRTNGLCYIILPLGPPRMD